MDSLPDDGGYVDAAGLRAARWKRDYKPVSVERAYRKIASCRDYRTFYGVFIPDKVSGPDSVILHSVYLKDADWHRYFVRLLAFEGAEKLAPHLCVGLYNNKFKQFSLAHLQSDVCHAFFYRAYWETLREFRSIQNHERPEARIYFLPDEARDVLHGFFDPKQDKYERPKKFTFARYNGNRAESFSNLPAFSIPRDDLPAYRNQLRAWTAHAQSVGKEPARRGKPAQLFDNSNAIEAHWDGNPDFYSLDVSKRRAVG